MDSEWKLGVCSESERFRLEDVGHRKVLLGGIIVERFGAQADVPLTQDEEGLSSGAIASEVRRGSRLKEISLLTSGWGR